MNIWLYTIVSVLTVSAASLFGIIFLQIGHKDTTGIVAVNEKWINKITPHLVSFAVGGLFGDAFIHLLPQAFDSRGSKLATSLYIIAGVLFFFALEKFIRWRHCHVLEYEEGSNRSLAAMVLIGDSIHNFIDGILIGASYIVSVPIGISTTLAVFFHEIPQELGDFGVLLHSGYSVKKALIFNFLTALTAVAGAMIPLTLGAGSADFAILALPFAAGGFIYIAGSDLIP